MYGDEHDRLDRRQHQEHRPKVAGDMSAEQEGLTSRCRLSELSRYRPLATRRLMASSSSNGKNRYAWNR